MSMYKVSIRKGHGLNEIFNINLNFDNLEKNLDMIKKTLMSTCDIRSDNDIRLTSMLKVITNMDKPGCPPSLFTLLTLDDSEVSIMAKYNNILLLETEGLKEEVEDDEYRIYELAEIGKYSLVGSVSELPEGLSIKGEGMVVETLGRKVRFYVKAKTYNLSHLLKLLEFTLKLEIKGPRGAPQEFNVHNLRKAIGNKRFEKALNSKLIPNCLTLLEGQKGK